MIEDINKITDMKENKQYKLKRWYPSLKKTVEVGCIITKIYTCGGYHYRGSDNEGVIFYVSGSQCENNPDFWELIKEEKPVFTTEDGVRIGNTYEVVVVDEYFIKDYWKLGFLLQHNLENIKVFAHESNADIYIRENNISPFYVTNDNVNIYHPKENVFLVNEFFEKDEGWYNESVGGKVFFHESNADEYIWRNKRVFSYEDMMKAKHSIILTYEDIEKAAKERSKE